MSKARELANLLDANGDVQVDALDTQPQLGRKNLIINGGFDVWQRGGSFTGSVYRYTADRWLYGGIATNTVLKKAHVSGATFPDGTPTSKYYARLSIIAAGDNKFSTRLEDVRNFHSKTVTLSCWLRSSVNTNIERVYLIQDFGSGGTPSADVITQGADNTSLQADVWKKVTFTADLPSIVGKTLGTNDNSFLEVRVDPNSAYTGNFDIAQVQLELGSVATPFEHRSYGEELALCQRYYWQGPTYDDGVGGRYWGGNATDGYGNNIPHPVMRVTPTITMSGGVYNNCSHYDIVPRKTGSHHRVSYSAGYTRAYAITYKADAEL
jgi:hypothetical protein